MNWFELDQFGGYLFFMFLGGAGFGITFGLLRFLLLTWIERDET